MDPPPSAERLSREDMEAILSVTRALAAPFDLDTLLAEVTSAACRLLRAQRSSVWTFRPAARTGGDTYNLALTAQGLLVVLGDATGHGVAPALSVTQMHAMLPMALRLGADLETAFRQVNDQLADTLPPGVR